VVHPTNPDGDHVPVVSSSVTSDVNIGVSSTAMSTANTLRSLSSRASIVSTNSLPHHSHVQPSVTLPLLTNSSTSDNSPAMMVSHQPTTNLRQPPLQRHVSSYNCSRYTAYAVILMYYSCYLLTSLVH